MVKISVYCDKFILDIFIGIVLCGKSQTGKSTMVEVLLHALRKHTREYDRDSQMAYHHEHINVLAVSSLNQMFGTINDEASGSGGGKQTTKSR